MPKKTDIRLIEMTMKIQCPKTEFNKEIKTFKRSQA